jgi:hypothetical protein
MAESNDADLLARQRHFLDQVEHAIRIANRKIIHKHVPKITRDDVLKLAMTVGEIRARYLQAALKLVDREEGVMPDAAEISRLAKARETFDEAVSAFEALRRAIERGYVDVKE